MEIKKKVDGGSNIAEVLERGAAAEAAFQKLGLKCVDCVAAEKENLADAARFHNVSLDRIVEELNHAVDRAGG